MPVGGKQKADVKFRRKVDAAFATVLAFVGLANAAASARMGQGGESKGDGDLVRSGTHGRTPKGLRERKEKAFG